MAATNIAAETRRVQRHIGPTPFSSARSVVQDPDVYGVARVDAVPKHECQQVRMHFHVPRHSAGGASASALWSRPPPTVPVLRGDTQPSVGPNGVPVLPKDTLHPLLSALQAAENAKASAMNPAVAFNSNAARSGLPCDAHVAMGRRGGQSSRDANQPSREDGDGDHSDADRGEDEHQDEEEDSPSAARGRSASRNHSKRGDIKTATGRAYNAEGAFLDADHYTAHIIDFATAQPTSATAIAAKALGAALHDRPSLALASNAFNAATLQPLPNSSVHGRSANRHLFSGLAGAPEGALPPSAAFRALPDRVKGLLLNRPHDTRLAVEAAVLDAAAHESEPGRGMNSSASSGSLRPAGEVPPRGFTAVPLGTATPTVDVAELLLRSGSLDIWTDAVRRSAPRNAAPDDPLPSSHPLKQPGGPAMRQLKCVAAGTASVYSSYSSRPSVSGFIGGCGLREGDVLAQVKLPSEASFVDDPARAKSVKQYANIPFTPSNAYGFDSDRFTTLLSHTGLEVEHIELEGATQITTLGDIARFCPSVKLLHLGGCTQLNVAALQAITQSCKMLTCVNLAAVALPAASVGIILGSCTDLMTLVLSANPAIDASCDPAWVNLKRHRRLRVLDLSFCPAVTDTALLAAAQYCPGLEVLDVTACASLSDVGISSIGASCPQLRVWKLGMCLGVSAVGLSALATATRHLEVLDMSGNTQITPSAVKDIVARLQRVVSLSLAGCTLVTDDVIQAVARHCRALVVLNLSSCTNVSLAGCMELINDIHTLSMLIASESSISNAEVVMLAALRETCTIIRNQYRPVELPTIIGYRAPEVVKKPAAKKSDKKK